MAAGLAQSEPRLEDAFGGKQPGLHITLEIVKTQGKYVAGDSFTYPTSASVRQPHCFGLPQPANPFPGVNFGGPSPDGAAYNPPQSLPTADRAAYNAAGVGSPAETDLVASLVAPSWNGDISKVPSIATLLAAPLLRGQTVAVTP
jgi:hypothetical protein